MSISTIMGIPSDGSVCVSSDRMAQPTYRVAGLGVTPAATPTDVLTLTGSATKTVRIKSVRLGGAATAAGNLPVQLVRRSTANTGGTASTLVAAKHDPRDPTATAVLKLYSANPTGVGTSAGTLGAGRIFLPATGTGQPFPLFFDFCQHQDKALVLRGASDTLAINCNGAAVPAGGLLDYEIEWEEDNS